MPCACILLNSKLHCCFCTFFYVDWQWRKQMLKNKENTGNEKNFRIRNSWKRWEKSKKPIKTFNLERVWWTRDQRKVLIEQLQSESGCVSTDMNTDGTVSLMIVPMLFPKKEDSLQKRKRHSEDRLAKLGKEKQNLKRKYDSLRKKTVRNSTKKENSSSSTNSKTIKMMRAAGIHPEDALDIKKQLIFCWNDIQENSKSLKREEE